MQQTGLRNSHHGVEKIGLDGVARLYWNDEEEALYNRAIERGEGKATYR